MILQQRIECLSELGVYMMTPSTGWSRAKEIASVENSWFIPEFIELAAQNIATRFLDKTELTKWAQKYDLDAQPRHSKKVGIVMAGNVPMVGFHDLLCAVISGQIAVIKTSSKDSTLIRHLVAVLAGLHPQVTEVIGFSEVLKNCDAYIATGSNNTSRFFEYYFGRFPHLIRRNKTSVAILTGRETSGELSKLADDVYQFFGLGCRNVTKIYVPTGYDFEPLLKAFKKYDYLAGHHKYRNNYDYNLALHILNNKFYITNGSLLLVEESSAFSPISQLNYEYYSNAEFLLAELTASADIQCVIGGAQVPFGSAQSPALTDYPDKADTLAFLNSL